jgi:hypothetical protein
MREVRQFIETNTVMSARLSDQKTADMVTEKSILHVDRQIEHLA